MQTGYTKAQWKHIVKQIAIEELMGAVDDFYRKNPALLHGEEGDAFLAGLFGDIDAHSEKYGQLPGYVQLLQAIANSL